MALEPDTDSRVDLLIKSIFLDIPTANATPLTQELTPSHLD